MTCPTKKNPFLLSNSIQGRCFQISSQPYAKILYHILQWDRWSSWLINKLIMPLTSGDLGSDHKRNNLGILQSHHILVYLATLLERPSMKFSSRRAVRGSFHRDWLEPMIMYLNFQKPKFTPKITSFCRDGFKSHIRCSFCRQYSGLLSFSGIEKQKAPFWSEKAKAIFFQTGMKWV